MYTFSAGSLQFFAADFSDHLSVIDKAIVGGEAGQFVQNVAGYENGDLIFPVEF